MTNTLTTDVESTLKQIRELEDAGADIVRVSCPDEDSTKSLKEIIKSSKVPIVADIHFTTKESQADQTTLRNRTGENAGMHSEDQIIFNNTKVFRMGAADRLQSAISSFEL